jgi:hypothetical protein
MVSRKYVVSSLASNFQVMFFYLLKANKLEQLRERMVKVHELFRDTESTEFVIVTIPTVTTVSVTS